MKFRPSFGSRGHCYYGICLLIAGLLTQGCGDPGIACMSFEDTSTSAIPRIEQGIILQPGEADSVLEIVTGNPLDDWQDGSRFLIIRKGSASLQVNDFKPTAVEFRFKYKTPGGQNVLIDLNGQIATGTDFNDVLVAATAWKNHSIRLNAVPGVVIEPWDTAADPEIKAFRIGGDGLSVDGICFQAK